MATKKKKKTTTTKKGATKRASNPPRKRAAAKRPTKRRARRRSNPSGVLAQIGYVAGGAALLGAATAAVREAVDATSPTMDTAIALGLPAAAAIMGSKVKGPVGHALMYGGAALVGVAVAERLGAALRARGVLASAPAPAAVTATQGRRSNPVLRLTPPMMRDQMDISPAYAALG